MVPSRHTLRLALLVVLLTTACGREPASPEPATATAQAQRASKLATVMFSTAIAGDAQLRSTQEALHVLVSEAGLWPLVLSDPFDSNEAQWPEGEKQEDLADIAWQVAAGQYEITSTAKDGFIWRAGPDVLPAIADFYLAADMQQTSGSETGEMGLVVRVTAEDEYYLFEINPQNQFAVYIYAAQDWETLHPWTETDLLRSGQANRLAVVAKGDQFLFLINGKMVASFADERLPRGTAGLAIGLYNKSDAGAWIFDNFELRSPEPLRAETPKNTPAGSLTGTPIPTP